MKKILCLLTATAVILCLMTACNFTTNFSNSAGNSAIKAAPKVEEMLSALATNDSDAALALLHSGVADNSENAVTQMADYLAGREAVQLEQRNVSVQSSSGTAGNVRQESVAYQAELDDGTVCYISAVYLTNSDGEGFASFQIVLGVV